MNLYSYFLNNTGKTMHKNVHYFQIYERHFSRFIGQSLTMIEIGTGGGGSAHMWKQYFGARARIVSLDINPIRKVGEDAQVSIRIGDQSDVGFLGAVLEEFGTPDIVLDDGSHQMPHVNATFDWLYPRIYQGGVYMIEDLHTAYWEEFGGGLAKANTFIERSKGFIDELNAEYTRGLLPETQFSKITSSIHYYDSVVVFERGRPPSREAFITGAVQTY